MGYFNITKTLQIVFLLTLIVSLIIVLFTLNLIYCLIAGISFVIIISLQILNIIDEEL